VPVTRYGRLFTCVYALVGMTVAASALSPIVQLMLSAIKKIEVIIEERAEKLAGVEHVGEDDELDLDQSEHSSHNWTRRYLLAIAVPIFILILGVVIGDTLLELDHVDSMYWAFVTMTTIGYGDLVPDNAFAKVVAMFYLPLGVAALAQALADVQRITTRKSIQDTDQQQICDKLLLQEALRNRDPYETLTEAEFLVTVLKAHDIVDEATLVTIRSEFRELVSDGAKSSVPIEDRVLDAPTVFRALKAQERVAQGMHYDEWFKRQWVPEVMGGAGAPTRPRSGFSFSDAMLQLGSSFHCASPRKEATHVLI